MFWSFGPGSAALEMVRQELERMQQAYGAAFQMLLGISSARTTPADELLCDREQRLLHYHPQSENLLATPLIIVPSLLNQSSLLDLAPSRSLVNYLLGQHMNVFGIDWRSPVELDRSLTLDFYCDFVYRAIERVCEQTGRETVSLLGYCSGGILTVITAAQYPHRIRNLIQMAAPVDFHDNGMISQWLRFGLGDVDLTLDTLAMMPPPLMRASLQMLKPTLQIGQQVALHSQLGEDGVVRDLLALQAWLSDSAFYPIEIYRTLIKSCYRQNALIQGQLTVNGSTVDLRAVTAALLIITAAQDRICPPESAQALHDIAASSDKIMIELPGGHLSMLSGRSATQTLRPQLADWLLKRSA